MSNQPDSDLTGGASGGQPGSTSQSGASLNSVDVDALLAVLESNPKFAAILERKAQSVKDQRFAKQEKALTAFQEKLQRLEELQKEGGMSRVQALNWMAMEERLDALQQAPQAIASGNGGGNTVTGTGDIDADAFLKAVGIDPTDPEVTALYRSGSVTPDQLVKLVTKKKTLPPVSVATAAPQGGGKSSAEDLAEQYDKEKAKLTPGSEEMYQLRRKYRGLGLPL